MSRRRSPSQPGTGPVPVRAVGGRRPIDPAGRCQRFVTHLPPEVAARVLELARAYRVPSSSLLRSLVLSALQGVEVAP